MEKYITPPNGYVLGKTVREYLSMDGYRAKNVIQDLVRKGYFPGVKVILLKEANSNKYRRVLIIPMESFNSFKNNYEIIQYEDKRTELRPRGYLSSIEVTRILGRHENYVHFLKKKGTFPNAIIFQGTLYIKPADLDQFISDNAERTKNAEQKFTNKQAIIKFSDRFDKETRNKIVLRETQQIYKRFGIHQLTCSQGSGNTLRGIVTMLCKLWLKLEDVLEKEFHLMTDKEVETLLSSNQICITHKKCFLGFMRYAEGLGNTKRTLSFTVNTSKISKNEKYDETIYSPEEYNSYLTYVRRDSLHIQDAILSQSYANMWLYTIMHLTNAWRSSDIIRNLPPVNLESINPQYSFDWFKNCNSITPHEAQKVINQVYLKVRNFIANKNKAILNFYITSEMATSFAYSIIISELHRRDRKREYLLQTFIVSGHLTKQPQAHHLRFFDNAQDIHGFSSLKMNRTTLTYLFYSVTEWGTSGSAEIALDLVQNMRSHERQETSSIYIKATNKDGSINRVSINLLQRGHFGWLYNYMIQLIQKENVHSLEERTKAIQHIRKYSSPNELETWGRFITQYKKRKESCITYLIKLSRLELIELVLKIFKGEQPSKSKNGQCIVHPHCDNPHYGSCINCEKFVPQELILFELPYEVNRLIDQIKKTENDTLLIRDSFFLNNILIVLNEAITTYGKEKINSYIKLSDLKKRLTEILDKLIVIK